MYNETIKIMPNRILFWKKRGGGANDLPPSQVPLLGLFAKWALATLFALVAFSGFAQLPIYPIQFCNPSNPTPLRVEIEPISTPLCGGVECNRHYFQVRLATNASFPSAPPSFIMDYEQLSLTIKMVTDPVGGLSSINIVETEGCSPAAFEDFPVDAENGNLVTLFLEGVCNSDPFDGPEVVFTSSSTSPPYGPPYRADLFVIAIDGVPGEDLQFEILQSVYRCPDYTVYCNDAIPLVADVFMVPSPSGTEGQVEILFDDYDPGTALLPVLAFNSHTGDITAEYLSLTAVIETDNIMDKPRLLNFVIPPVEQSVDPIPGTDDWRVFVRFEASPGITVPASDQIALFDIEIKGPVNESLEAFAEVCLTQGQMRREGFACRVAKLSTNCAEIEFEGHQPCDPNNFTVVVSEEFAGVNCNELEVRVQLNWSGYASALDFDRIRIAVEFDLPPGVTIDGIGTNTFGCPANPSCNPSGGFTDCFKIDGNRVTFCFFPNMPEEVLLGSYFTVLFDAPSNCVNGATVREAMVDVSTDPPGGSECVTNVVVETDDFPICSPLLAGWVKNVLGEHVDDVDVVVTKPVGGCSPVSIWPNNAPWSHCPCDGGEYRVKPQVRHGGDAWTNGVTTYDLVLIQKHILYEDDEFTTIYQYAAADANGDGMTDKVMNTYPDIIELRKLILGIYDELPDNNSWRYFLASSTGDLPTSPPQGTFEYPAEHWQGNPSATDINFVAVKVGDVNNTHNNDYEMRPAGTLPLLTEALPRTAKGGHVSVPLRYAGTTPLSALQMGLRFDADAWELVGVTSGDVLQVSEDCFNLNGAANGEIRFAWYCADPDDQVRTGQALFFLSFRAKNAARGDLAPLRVDDGLLRSIAYASEGAMYDLDLGAEAVRRDQPRPSSRELEVVCSPNPSSGAVTLSIRAAEGATKATVWAYSAFGDRLLRREIPLTGRTTDFQFPDSAHWPAGMYVWKVRVGDAKTEGRLLKQ